MYCQDWSFEDDLHFNPMCTNTLGKEVNSASIDTTCKMCVTPARKAPVSTCAGCTPVTRPGGWSPVMRLIVPGGLTDSSSGAASEVKIITGTVNPIPINEADFDIINVNRNAVPVRKHCTRSVRWAQAPSQQEFVLKNRGAYRPDLYPFGSCVWSWVSASWFGDAFHNDVRRLKSGGTASLHRTGWPPDEWYFRVCHNVAEQVAAAEYEYRDYTFSGNDVGIANYFGQASIDGHGANGLFLNCEESAEIDPVVGLWPAYDPTADDPRVFPVEGTEYSVSYRQSVGLTSPWAPCNKKLQYYGAWKSLGVLGGYKIDLIIGKRVLVYIQAIESWYRYTWRQTGNGAMLGFSSTGPVYYNCGTEFVGHPDNLYCEPFLFGGNNVLSNSTNYFNYYHPTYPTGEAALVGGVPWSKYSPKTDNHFRPVGWNGGPEVTMHNHHNGFSAITFPHASNWPAYSPWNPIGGVNPLPTDPFWTDYPWAYRFAFGRGMRQGFQYFPPNWTPEEGGYFVGTDQLCVWASDLITCDTKGTIPLYKMADFRTNARPAGSPQFPINFEPVAGPVEFPPVVYVDVGA